MKNHINIAGKRIGDEHPTFIVAEIGANHNGSVALAKKIIDEAVNCGVDAVKFQTYTSTELVADLYRNVTWGPKGKQVTENIADMFDRIALQRSSHREVFEYAQNRGLIAFSTPFSVDGLQFLNNLDVPCIKIASSDVNYQDLLIAAGRINKPIMLSLGKCSIGEADEAVDTLFSNGCEDLVLMHCVAQYPTPMEDVNLNIIRSLKTMYPNCVVGFSDHSLGITASLGAVALGARVIEKHFTLGQSLVGPDHWFSLDPMLMKSLVTEIRNLESAMGFPRKRILESEKAGRQNSIRSLVLARDLDKGHSISANDLKVLRPGGGISPFDRDKVIGMKITSNLPMNTLLQWDHFK